MADDEVSMATLVSAAADGDQGAWNDIVNRYSPLLVGILRHCRLSTAETEDVAQTVWLRLVEHLEGLREARALPMWIITTGRREAWRYLANARRVQLQDPGTDEWTRQLASADTADDELLHAERHEALLAGLAELGPRDRQLLHLLLEDPVPSYAEISRRIGMPVGGIGPTRARALDRLRRTAAIEALMVSEADCCPPVARTKG